MNFDSAYEIVHRAYDKGYTEGVADTAPATLRMAARHLAELGGDPATCTWLLDLSTQLEATKSNFLAGKYSGGEQ